MPFPLAGLLIGTGAGLLKSVASDAPRRQAQQRVQAETTRWSPWTGMVGQAPTVEFDPFGSAMQGGLSGASFEQLASGGTPGSSYSGMASGSPGLGVNANVGDFSGLADKYPGIFRRNFL